MNKLSDGDNLDVLRKFVRDETIDLCSIDPLLNSKMDITYQSVALILKRGHRR